MFKHILLPTDGSDLSNDALRKGVTFARETGAKLTFIHVMPEYIAAAFAEFPAGGQAAFADFMKATEDTANAILGTAEAAAHAAKVTSDRVAVRHQQPWRAIIEVAGERKCDLIFMASHGRRGLSAVVLGSETHKVLTHSKIPVLVFR